MATFEVVHDSKATDADGSANIPKFIHAKGAHDDFLHSLCWAVYSLREHVLNAYELDGVNCHGTAALVPLCALNGGQLIPGCADSCRSMHDARRLHLGYLSRKPMAPLPLDEFIVSRVKNVGAHSLPR